MVIAGRIDHVAIAAENTEAMAKWYERVLGLVTHAVAGPNPPQTQKVYMIGPPAANRPEGKQQANTLIGPQSAADGVAASERGVQRSHRAKQHAQEGGGMREVRGGKRAARGV